MMKENGHEDSQIGSRPADEQERTGSRERLTSGGGEEGIGSPAQIGNTEKQVSNQGANPGTSEKQANAPGGPVSSPDGETEHADHGLHGLNLRGILTSAGPPLGFTHPASAEELEMGTFSQPPDPALEADPKDENQYFAVPGGPGVMQNRDEMSDGNDPNAFFHPATKEPQMILWLPRDELGLCEAEIEENAKWGVESTCRFAILDHNVSNSFV
jgi:hypothetical protein